MLFKFIITVAVVIYLKLIIGFFPLYLNIKSPHIYEIISDFCAEYDYSKKDFLSIANKHYHHNSRIPPTAF